MRRQHRSSFRHRFRAFQAMRGDPPCPEFIADLEFLENRDSDLSVRIGAMLAFNALLVTIGTHPVSASPGAPLSLDAATRPLMTVASLFGVLPFVLSSFLCLRALLWGEEFDHHALPVDETPQQRLFAAFILSIDAQSTLLRQAVWATLTGGMLTMVIWTWILAEKMMGAR